MEEQNLMPFEGKSIRKVWHNEEWHFSVVDVVGVLAESANPQSYWGQLKKREPHLLTICQKVRLKGQDGKRHIRLDTKRTWQGQRLGKTEFTRPHDAD